MTRIQTPVTLYSAYARRCRAGAPFHLPRGGGWTSRDTDAHVGSRSSRAREAGSQPDGRAGKVPAPTCGYFRGGRRWGPPATYIHMGKRKAAGEEA